MDAESLAKIERIAAALESIAGSLIKLTSPAMVLTPKEDDGALTVDNVFYRPSSMKAA